MGAVAERAATIAPVVARPDHLPLAVYAKDPIVACVGDEDRPDAAHFCNWKEVVPRRGRKKDKT